MKCKVLIAGGGPAGMATAIVLRSRGIDCTIAEQVAVPPIKAGETIPPNAKALFAKLGIDALLNDAAHLPCYGNKFIWGEAGAKDFFSSVHGHGWHLNRMQFELQLRDHVQRIGVNWIDDSWQANNNYDFIVDATGRASRVARSFGIQRKRLDMLTGYWCVLQTAEQVKPFYTYIEATSNGWWYAAPLQDKKLSLAFMTDSDLSHAGYFETARTLSLIGPLLEKAGVHGEPVVNPASTSYLTARFGPNWLAVGDAAYAYDPISSYGIASALENGFFAGHAIADHYEGNANALPSYDYLISTSFSNYLNMHAQQYLQETRWRNEPFWQRRPLKL